MTVGELMGVIVDGTLPGDPTLKLTCSGCSAYGEELEGDVTALDAIVAAEAHIRAAHRQEGLRVPDALRAGLKELGLIVDRTTPRFLRVKAGCVCGKWTMGFQALPNTEVTLNRLLAATAEHRARQHGYRPAFEGVSEGGSTDAGRLPTADVIGPLSG